MSTLHSKPNTITLDFDDEFRLLLHSEYDTVVDFELFEIVHMTREDNGKWVDPCFELYDYQRSGDETKDMALACPQIRGTVKFDGCSHVYFGNAPTPKEPQNGYLHLCGRRCWEKHIRMMRIAFHECRKRLKERGYWYDD